SQQSQPALTHSSSETCATPMVLSVVSLPARGRSVKAKDENTRKRCIFAVPLASAEVACLRISPGGPDFTCPVSAFYQPLCYAERGTASCVIPDGAPRVYTCPKRRRNRSVENGESMQVAAAKAAPENVRAFI